MLPRPIFRYCYAMVNCTDSWSGRDRRSMRKISPYSVMKNICRSKQRVFPSPRMFYPIWFRSWLIGIRLASITLPFSFGMIRSPPSIRCAIDWLNRDTSTELFRAPMSRLSVWAAAIGWYNRRRQLTGGVTKHIRMCFSHQRAVGLAPVVDGARSV